MIKKAPGIRVFFNLYLLSKSYFADSLAFLVSMKLWINAFNAQADVKIITTTLIIGKGFPLSIEPVSGLISPIKIIRVNKTAMWAITLFSFLTPLLINSNTIPTTTGIRAVTALDSAAKYPHKPIETNATAFTKLAIFAFILIFWLN